MTTASAPGPAPTPPPAFPPPTPEELAAGSGGRANRLLASFAVVALLAAAVMTVLWLGERDDDTPAEPPPELSERAATLERELADTEAARSAAAAEAARLQGELDAVSDQLTADSSASDELAAAAATNDRLQQELDDARLRIDELDAELFAALESPPEPAPTAPDTGGFDATSTPEFARWVGELLSSRTGSSRLGQEASTCFGTEVISRVGVDAVGAGQNNAAGGAERQIVIDAMNDAAAACGIDPGLIFS